MRLMTHDRECKVSSSRLRGRHLTPSGSITVVRSNCIIKKKRSILFSRAEAEPVGGEEWLDEPMVYGDAGYLLSPIHEVHELVHREAFLAHRVFYEEE